MREKERVSSDFNAVMGAPPSSKPNYLSKPPSPNWGLGLQHMNLEEIQTFSYNSVCVCFSIFFLALQYAAGSSCVFPAQSGSNDFSKEPWFILLENGIRNQDLGTRYSYCYWSVIASRPSQQTEQGNMCMYTNPRVDKYL